MFWEPVRPRNVLDESFVDFAPVKDRVGVRNIDTNLLLLPHGVPESLEDIRDHLRDSLGLPLSSECLRPLPVVDGLVGDLAEGAEDSINEGVALGVDVAPPP